MNSSSTVHRAQISATPSPTAPVYARPSIPASSSHRTPSVAYPMPESQVSSASPSQGVVNRILTLSRGISLASSSVQRAVIEDLSSEKGAVERAREFSDKAIELYRFISSQGKELGLSVSLNQGPDDIAQDVGRIGEAYVQREIVPLLKREAAEVLVDRLGMSPEYAYDLLGESAPENFRTATQTPSTQSAALGGQILGAAGVAYTAFDLIKNYGRYSPVEGALRGAVAGAYVGTNLLPGVGTLFGGLIGGVGGFIGGLFSRSGKSKEQKERDQIRNLMKQVGIIDSNHALTLADGTKYDIGKDGGHRIPCMNGEVRRAYEIDASNPLAAQALAMANPLAALITGGRVDRQADIAGYFVNAALSNAGSIEDAHANMQAIFASFNLTPDQIANGISQLHHAGIVQKEVALSYLKGVELILGGSTSLAA